MCCGAGGLSRALRLADFRVFAVDHEANKHSPLTNILELDLTDRCHQEVFMRLLHATRPKYLHMGLPCGTCSRARERRLPGLLARGGPPPLRDEYHLMGLPGLGALDSAKVASANALYRFAVQVLHTCMLHSVLVSVENPTRSWLWRILES